MIDATPRAGDLWAGIAGHFDSVSQVLCEFIDNCISNLEASQKGARSVLVVVKQLGTDEIEIHIEDTGTGIKDLAPTMRLGDTSARQSPLNEHGFGLKHALASANPLNDSWAIYTRTLKDFESGVYHLLKSPYEFTMQPIVNQIAQNPWPGEFNGSGTLIAFKCSSIFFNTIQRGIKGQAGFRRCLDYLVEELGYVYSGIIEKGQATISVVSFEEQYRRIVASVQPSWVDYYPPGSGKEKLDLGGGELTVEYQFGEMRESNYVKHYKRNQSSSGVELRINGRVMMANVFKDIWGLENHPSYNHFLATINLVSTNANTLPKTRTSKNGIRSGDPKLERLFEWIKKTHPTPHKDLASAQSERELVKEVAELKEKQIRNKAKHIEIEFKVFTTLNSPVSVDLYVFDGHDVVLYEAKKDTADIQDAYQLLMYWDGCVEDGATPTEGILLASDFSPGVDVILGVMNACKDRRGNPYNFSKKTWSEEGIRYPK